MLTAGQTQALDFLSTFLDSDATAASLQGGAGVGKTYLTSEFIKQLLAEGRTVVVAAPTHKACAVLRAKLDAAGIKWAFKPKAEVPAGVAVVDTTAALLGIRPVDPDVDAPEGEQDERTFKTVGAGSLQKLFGVSFSSLTPVLLVDEASMVPSNQFWDLHAYLKAGGAKLVCIGDSGQLPPVKAVAIDFEADFDGGAFTLTEVVRQAKGSSIIGLAWVIRLDTAEGAPETRKALSSAGLLDEDVRVAGEQCINQFLAQVTVPAVKETERTVFIAYRNSTVDYVQEHAAQKVYQHSASEFRTGELVIASTAAYAETFGTYVCKFTGKVKPSKFPRKEQVVAVADQLKVVSLSDAADPVYGRPVKLERIDLPAGASGRFFTSYFLSREDQKNPEHPFAQKTKALREEALKLAREVKALRAEGKHQAADDVDKKRGQAWGALYDHQQKVVGFTHPFAITSHKSQGSTYHTVFAATAELLQYNRKALYVAVTRPSKFLVL